MDNFSKGWVASYRCIKDHWLNDRDDYYRWWDIMIKTVNHSDYKFTLGDNIYNIERGQSALSKVHWREILSNRNYTIGRKKFDTFLKLLVKDNMITIKTIGKGNLSSSLITVTNYGLYQDVGNTRRTREEHKADTRGTRREQQLNNDNNDNNDKQIKDVVEEVSNADGSKWYDWFCTSWNLNSLEHRKKKSYLRSLTKSAQGSLKVILEDFTQEDVKKAMVGLMVQKSFPNQQELANDPTHLLKDDGVFIGKYSAAFESADREIYGKVKKFE